MQRVTTVLRKRRLSSLASGIGMGEGMGEQ